MSCPRDPMLGEKHNFLWPRVKCVNNLSDYSNPALPEIFRPIFVWNDMEVSK